MAALVELWCPFGVGWGGFELRVEAIPGAVLWLEDIVTVWL